MHQKSVKQNMDFHNFPELFPENSEILYIDTHNYLLFTKDKNPVVYWIQTQNNKKMHELLDKVSGDHKNITINIPPLPKSKITTSSASSLARTTNETNLNSKFLPINTIRKDSITLR
mgnify:CR=1 FL=1